MHHLDCRVSDEELRAIAAEKELSRTVAAVAAGQPVDEA
jgi:hypothetical protein